MLRLWDAFFSVKGTHKRELWLCKFIVHVWTILHLVLISYTAAYFCVAMIIGVRNIVLSPEASFSSVVMMLQVYLQYLCFFYKIAVQVSFAWSCQAYPSSAPSIEDLLVTADGLQRIDFPDDLVKRYCHSSEVRRQRFKY